MVKEKVRGAAVITFLSLLYFIWLVIVVLKDQGYLLENTNLFLSLEEWAIIGIILYAIFVIVLIYYYLTLAPEGKTSAGIKLVSAVTTRVVCDKCHAVITLSDAGTRPLRYACPNCGKSYLPPGAAGAGPAVAEEAKDICPHCETDRGEWYRRRGGSEVKP